MTRYSLNEREFRILHNALISETSNITKTFDILYYSRGSLSALQAATILSCFATAPERVRVIKALEKRLCRMTCAEAREILKVIQLTNLDRLFALDCIKRSLVDHHYPQGIGYILSAFEYECDKLKALNILSTVNMEVGKELASGGHQMYGPCGEVYDQSFPVRETLYGSIEDQIALKNHELEPSLPLTARYDLPASIFKSAPSRLYNGDFERSYYLGGGKPPLSSVNQLSAAPKQ